MKIGDLVCLSRYGLARDYNTMITRVDPYQVGIILDYNSRSDYPFRVLWARSSNDHQNGRHSHSRRELKYASR